MGFLGGGFDGIFPGVLLVWRCCWPISTEVVCMHGVMRVGDTHVAMGHVSGSPRTVVKNLWDMCIHARNLSKSCETERLTQPNLKRQVVYLEPQ